MLKFAEGRLRLVSKPLLLLAGVLIFGRPARCADDARPLGIVQRASGSWTSSSGKKLTRGDFVASGERVIAPPAQRGSIAVLLFDSGDVWRKDCTVVQPCEGAFELPSSEKPQTTGLFRFVANYFKSGKELPPVFAGSRSLKQHGPSHALLVLNDQKINLRMTLDRLVNGKYMIVLGNESNLSPDRQVTKFKVDWKLGSDLLVAAPPPGLYALQVVSENGENVGSPAAVLIVLASATKEQHTWKDVKTRTAQWHEADEGTVDTVLLATLVALQDQNNRTIKVQ